MSGLVNLIPPQNEHVGTTDEEGNVKFNMNWYLFIYNISSKLGGTGQPAIVYLAGGALGTPASGNLVNCTGYTYGHLAGAVPTWNQNTTGSSSYATTAGNLTGLTASISNLNSVTGTLGSAAFTASSAYQPAISSYTIAGLPAAPATGTKAYVTNGQAVPVFMGAVSVTGTVFAPVFYNGSAWLYG